MKDSIIILCGGGPAPGMNTVVCTVAKTFLSRGFRVIGLHGGYSGLFNTNPKTEDIDFFKEAQYMINKPLCIHTDDAELLEKALFYYQGRALYEGAVEETALEELEKKYGVICL